MFVQSELTRAHFAADTYAERYGKSLALYSEAGILRVNAKDAVRAVKLRIENQRRRERRAARSLSCPANSLRRGRAASLWPSRQRSSGH